MSDPCGQPVGWVLRAFGFLGQAFFSMRFLVQWIASDRKRKRGGLTLLIYTILRVDPVFIVGQGAGLFVYCRTLYLIWRKRERLATSHGA